MTLYVCASDYGNGTFKFATSARWNKMPAFRGKDSIAVTAQEISVTENTVAGYYSYTKRTYVNGTLTSTENNQYNPITIDNSQFQFVSDGGTFHGAGTVINLPNDVAGGNTATLYSDYFVYMEFSGHIRQPNEETWFNVVGSYSHTLITISSSPNLSVDGKGVSGSVGLNLNFTQERRNAYFEGHHVLT